MDITLSKSKRASGQYINGETVNYAITCIVSFTVLIAIKQILKTFFGVDTAVACCIAFIIAEAVLFLLEKFFVFKRNAEASFVRQALLTVVNALMHFGIYKLAIGILRDSLGLFDFTVWFIVAVFIFIINYPLARILIFNCAHRCDDMKNGRVYRLFFRNRFIVLAMAISLICMGFMFIVFKVFPFGDMTVLRMDLYHQYGPLFVELFDRVTQGKSFIYSWTSGGGSAFIGNYFNYLSSPLNFLIFLFDRDQMPYAISFLVAIKCMLSSGTFAFYLKKSQKRHAYASAAFGVLYSFSAYMLAYFWNIMWLDGMFMLPLIALGIENIINNRKCALYVISLIYSFYASYYIGFMLCIFSVIYFIAYFFISLEDRVIDANYFLRKRYSIRRILDNKFFNRGVIFALSSVFAASVCAFFLLPVYFILSGSSATSDSFPSNISSYFTVFDFIQNHFAGLETTIRSSGEDVLPNIYCGVITLLLAPLFVINKEIRLREKIVYISVLLLFFVSFNMNYVNFVWHAFHFPNDLPYRFSFMYSFILLIISFKALMHIKAIGIKEIGFVGMFWIAAAAVSQELPTNKITDFTVYATIAFVIIWAALLFFTKSKKADRLVIGALIIAIAFCEVVISDTNSFGFNQELTMYNENYENYTEAVNYIKESDDSFYRTELCDLNTRMDPCIYGYDGISTFSSMAYEDYSRLQYSLGMYGNRINSYTYHTQTPVYNLMYGIKYLIYNGIDTRPTTDLYTKYYQTNVSENTVIYENDYTLPVAFGVNSAVDYWSTAEGDPFLVQSDFFTLATGLENVFLPAEYVSYYVQNPGMTCDPITENGSYWFMNSDSGISSIEIILRAVTDGNLYLYINSSEIRTVNCKSENQYITQYVETPYILDLGYFNTGEELTVTVDSTVSGGNQGNFKIYAYSINKDVFDEGYAMLLANSLNITEHSDTRLSGTVEADRDCMFYSSIPYDDGWRVRVDGEKADTFRIGNCQLGINLSAGSHTVEYSFVPKGAILGGAVSAAALLGFIALVIIKKQKELLK